MAGSQNDTGNPVARFPNGFTNVGASTTLNKWVAPDPTKVVMFFDDFNTFDSTEWTITETDAAATEALTSGNGGLLLISNTAGASDYVAVETAPVLASNTGKKKWLKARLKSSSVTNHGFDVVAVNTAATYTKFIGVGMDPLLGHTNWAVFWSEGGVDLNIDSGVAAVADTFVTLGIYYDGQTKLYLYVNEVLKGSYTTSLPDVSGADLTLCMETLNKASAIARTVTVDYIMFAQER